ncbi:MAG: hypothetical protein ACW977_06760 [Candidatus Thorarchaeota archaeon]
MFILLIIPYGSFFLFTSGDISVIFASVFYYRISDFTIDVISLYSSPIDLLMIILVLTPSFYYLFRTRNSNEVKRPILLFALVCFATWDITLILVPYTSLNAISNLWEIDTLVTIPRLATLALTALVVLPAFKEYLAKKQELNFAIPDEDDINIMKRVANRLRPRSYATILGIVAFLSPSIITFTSASPGDGSTSFGINYILSFTSPLYESQISWFGLVLGESTSFRMLILGSVPIVSILFFYIPQLLFVCQILRYFVGKTTFRMTAIIGLILHIPSILTAIAGFLLPTIAVLTISLPTPITAIAAVILYKRLKEVLGIGPLGEARKATSVKVPTLYVAKSRLKRKLRRESKE